MRLTKSQILRLIPILLALFWQQSVVAAFETTENRVTDSIFHESTPTIGNDGTRNLVVYTSRELLNTGMFDQADIYWRYLDDKGAPVGNPFRLTAAPQTDDVLNDVDGDYIVYTAFENTTSLAGNIMLYSISRGQIRPLSDLGFVRDPKINGNYVVWLQGPPGSTEVILYDLRTNIAQTLAGPAPPTFFVEIGSRFVVWASLDGDYDIWVYDFELGAQYAITASALTDERYPSTDGDWIVWEARDASSPTGRIEAYNGRTGEFRVIVADGAINRLPSAHSDRITWESNKAGNFDVYLHRLETSETFQVTSDAGDQYLNDIYGNLVAYVDRRFGDEDIFVSHFTQSPVSVPSVDQTTTNRGVLVTLDGSASYDPDNDYPLSYLWKIEFAPGASTAQLADPTAAVTIFTPDVLGFYTISLTVTDAQGGHGGPEWVIIETENAAPVADAGPDQVVEVLSAQVILDGSQSYDPDGDPITFAWTVTHQPSGNPVTLNDPTSPAPTFYADVQGDYIGTLVVTDSLGAAGSDTVTVSFNNLPPVADAGTSQSALVGETVILDGTSSYDPNGDPITYAWAIVTAPAGSAATIISPASATASFVPDFEGLYIVQLKVNDGQVDSEPDTVQIQATSVQTEATTAIETAQDGIAALDPGVFKNKNLQSTLNDKLNAVLANIADQNYADALGQLQNDILKKTNGCADTGAPDKNDWIRDCVSQSVIYPLILDAIAKVQALMP